MTLYDIIKSIAKHSEDIYIYDFSFFNGEQDIYHLYKGVKKIKKVGLLDQLDFKVLNRELNFQKLELSESTVEYYSEKIKCFGLFCKNNYYALYNDIIESVEKYSSECFSQIIDSIPFEKKVGLTEKEYEIVEMFSHRMLSLFQIFNQYDLVFLQYLCKCISNMDYYSKNSLECMFLISFSEVPDFVEAIKYIAINEKSLVLEKKNIKISKAFESLYSSKNIKKFISQSFLMSNSEVEALIFDMVSILNCF
ncbi:MAG: hypothetical protein IJ366_10020 [Clostridia bacterium]|nr:hypothetical protein [Clostridia bacterium]